MSDCAKCRTLMEELRVVGNALQLHRDWDAPPRVVMAMRLLELRLDESLHVDDRILIIKAAGAVLVNYFKPPETPQ